LNNTLVTFEVNLVQFSKQHANTQTNMRNTHVSFADYIGT